MRKLVYFMVVLLLAGCASTAKYEKILDSWVGNSEDALIEAWGPPDRVYEINTSKKVITYIRSFDMKVGGYSYTEPVTSYTNGTVNSYGSYGGQNYTGYSGYSGVTTTYVQKKAPVSTLNFYCETHFTVTHNIVSSWRWKGNNCVAD